MQHPHSSSFWGFLLLSLPSAVLNAGPSLMVPCVVCLCIAVILGKSHYVLYGLVAAMQPRMLVTFDEELRPLPVSVRVGQVSPPRIGG